MTIEIVDVRLIDDLDGNITSRHADIIITDNGNAYTYGVGGLPLVGNLQTILDGREAELLGGAVAKGQAVDLYNVTPKKVLKAFALVVLDEINALRNVAGLQPRTAGQIEGAIKAKLKEMAQ